jgi:uncharacterized protein (TIGR03067 family)
MKTRHVFLAAACLFAAAGCGNLRDRSLLGSGHWVVESAELGGHQEPTEAFDIVFSPHGNSVTITVGTVVHKGVYELQTDKDPKEIDIKPDASNRSDKQMYGIYALDADGQGLLLCLSQKHRPKKFETSAGSDNFLIKLRRQPGVK